jgi:deoxyribose-phosphate aldolase
MGLDPRRFAAACDHAVLDPLAGGEAVRRAASEALRRRLAAVVVLPAHLPLLVDELGDGVTAPVTVAGFPLGGEPAELKALAVAWAVSRGAREVDVVLNLAALRSGDDDAIHREARAVHEAAAGRGLKWILETGLLREAEIDRAVALLAPYRPAFLKTSTGMLGPGATPEGVRRLVDRLPEGTGVKASGGIRAPQQALALLEAGATRLGTSRGPELYDAVAGAAGGDS